MNTKIDLDRRRAAAGVEQYPTGRLFEIALWGTVTNTPEPQFGIWNMLV